MSYDFDNLRWTTEGCRTEVNDDVITCTCNHLTNFAALVVRTINWYSTLAAMLYYKKHLQSIAYLTLAGTVSIAVVYFIICRMCAVELMAIV